MSASSSAHASSSDGGVRCQARRLSQTTTSPLFTAGRYVTAAPLRAALAISGWPSAQRTYSFGVVHSTGWSEGQAMSVGVGASPASEWPLVLFRTRDRRRTNIRGKTHVENGPVANFGWALWTTCLEE